MSKNRDRSEDYLKRRITRRQAIKAGGIAALGLAFSKPVIETIRPKSAFAQGQYRTIESGVTLLFRNDIGMNGNTNLRPLNQDHPVVNAAGMTIVLAFDTSGLTHPQIGNNHILRSGETGSFKIDATNSPEFEEYGSRISNGDTHLGVSLHWVDPGGQRVWQGGGSGSTLPSSLQGTIIESVILTVKKFTWEIIPSTGDWFVKHELDLVIEFLGP